MCASRSLLLWATIIIWYSMVVHCIAFPKKTTCEVQDGKADCSHLSLTAVPPNLPRNITSLDLSHNRLVGIPPVSLKLYPDLVHLDVGFNSITKLDEGWCQTLPLLQTLNVQHNEVHLLKKDDLNHCTKLIQLNVASNRLKLQGEPFTALQVHTAYSKH